MSDERQATITFSGLPKVMAGTITWSRGITPSTISLQTVPQANLAEPVGDITVEWGRRLPGGELDATDPQAESFTLIDCAVDFSSIEVSGAQIWSLQLFDRRWRWQRGEISGKYNQRTASGAIDTATAKTPQELATLCLDAMGETGYTVTNMPNTQDLTVNWDVANPAQCLQQICEAVKCEIVLTLAEGNPVVIHRRGVGEELPDTKVGSFSNSANTGQAPETIRVVCGPTLFQRRLLLEAVGVETEANDSVLTDLASLSYKPSAGFQDPLYMHDVTASEEAKRLAQESVYRYFRPLEFADGSLNLPSLSPGFTDSEGTAITAITSIRQVRLTTGLLETREVGGQLVPQSPRLYGTFFDNKIKGENVTDKQYKGEFTVDASRGIVITREPLVYDGGSGVWEEPTLYLEVAFTIDDAMRAPVRHRRDQAFTGTDYDGRVHVIRDETKQRTVRMPYTDIDTEDTAVDNVTTLNTDLDELIDYENDAFEAELGQDVVYRVIRAIELDGAIRQVVWTIGGGRAAETRAARNKDADQYGLSEEARKKRQQDRLRDTLITAALQGFALNGELGKTVLRAGEGTT